VTTESQASKGAITKYLDKAPTGVFVLYAIFAAFSTYFCMYAFRKPFSAAEYKDLFFGDTGINLKTAFVISQIIGYTISKYLGCKFCSEVSRSSQAKALIAMIGIALAALVGFAIAPQNLKVVAIFFNGLPLGMIWGLVSRYLEGRKTAELLFAGLSCSYIIASSSVKAVGESVMNAGVSEFWMPATVGAIFLIPFGISVFLLSQLPEPGAEDIASRSERTTMDGEGRMAFLKQFLTGMIMLLVLYFFLTAYRDFRDNYMKEVFKDMRYDFNATVFIKADLLSGVGIMVVMAALNLVKDHQKGLKAVYGVMIAGMALMAGATLMHDLKMIDDLWWMILIGFGAYLAYVPFGAVLFERTMASTKAVGTAVFAIYLSDAIGYTGSVGIQLYKDLGEPELNYFQFLRKFTYSMAGIGIVLFTLSSIYFLKKARETKSLSAEDPA
jgi:hypothetical protein